MPTRGTIPLPIRLSPADRERIQAIRDHHGLSSSAEAVRFAVNLAYLELPPAPGPKKSAHRAV